MEMDPKLPPDVTDRIIDFLWNEQKALYCCALTCHGWLPCSRFHLFNGILTIKSRSAFFALVRTSQMSHLEPYFALVRTLVIDESCVPNCRSAPQRSFCHMLGPVLGHRLAELKDLSIQSVDWSTIPVHWSFQIGLTLMPNINTLMLKDCTFSTSRDIQRLVCSLPYLIELTLHNVRTERHLPSGPQHGSASPGSGYPSGLCSLKLIGQNDNRVVDWILSPHAPHPVEVLHVDYCTPQVPTVQNYIRSRGGSLKLASRSSHNRTSSQDYLQPTVASCDNMHPITLLTSLRRSSPEVLLGLLSQIPPNAHLRHLVIGCTVDSNLKSDWSTVETLLSSDRLCDLETVCCFFHLGDLQRIYGPDLRQRECRQRLERDRPNIDLKSIRFNFTFTQFLSTEREWAKFSVHIHGTKQISSVFSLTRS
ncbi:hypothetical protein B0H21DRAFT_505065 [Amylocystis lapponica]|nr:hypothetical protein B0H21DRAFT_505065 [Amylocystis lapponica]